MCGQAQRRLLFPQLQQKYTLNRARSTPSSRKRASIYQMTRSRTSLLKQGELCATSTVRCEVFSSGTNNVTSSSDC